MCDMNAHLCERWNNKIRQKYYKYASQKKLKLVKQCINKYIHNQKTSYNWLKS